MLSALFCTRHSSLIFFLHTLTQSWPQLSTLSAFSQRCLSRRARLQWIEWIVTVAEVYCMKQNSCESLSCQGTWVHMIGHTLERSHSVAQSVTRVSYIQVTWRNMKEPTQEKSHSNALSVTRASQDQVTWRHMIGPTQDRNHSVALGVTRASYIQVTWRNMKHALKLIKDTREDSHMRKALQLYQVWQDLLPIGTLDDTLEDPVKREAI